MTDSTMKIIAPEFPDQIFKGGRIFAEKTMANALVALNAMHVECSYDVFHDRRIIGGHVLGSNVGQVSDDVCLLFRKLCRIHFKFDPGKDNTWDAINLRCRENSFHPIIDYLQSLTWDGVPRIGNWLVTYMGAPDTPFVRAVGEMQLVASVRRVVQPGCKYDYMCVLESPEGYNKSSALAALYGAENFSDQSILGLSDKELHEAVRGRWGMEAADLSGMRKAEVEKVKAQLSRQIDRTRPAYGRATIDTPRCCVFWGSTNDVEYMRSQTGNRRILPVPVRRIDLKAIMDDRDQLWAEAAWVEASESSIALPEALWEVAGVEQAARTKQDPWQDTLADISRAAAMYERDKGAGAKVHYDRRPQRDGSEIERITSEWVIGNQMALNIAPAQQGPDVASRVRLLMTKLGWTYDGKLMWIGGRGARGYWRRIERDLLAE
jgi:predicted P-loop ATPase